jgi:hypothetical protein
MLMPASEEAIRVQEALSTAREHHDLEQITLSFSLCLYKWGIKPLSSLLPHLWQLGVRRRKRLTC